MGLLSIWRSSTIRRSWIEVLVLLLIDRGTMPNADPWMTGLEVDPL